MRNKSKKELEKQLIDLKQELSSLKVIHILLSLLYKKVQKLSNQNQNKLVKMYNLTLLKL